VRDMRRREFLGLVAGAAAWPFSARARKAIPTIMAVMVPLADGDESKRHAFEASWPELGWVEGRTIHVDYRWAKPPQMRAVAAEVVAAAPDVIVADGTSVLNALREATSTVPVVFTGVSDPEGTGVVTSLARPGGNMTGFANFEPSIGGKWLEVLREMAPQLNRVGVLRVPKEHLRIVQSIRDNAASGSIEVVDCPVVDDPGIRAAVGAFDGQPRTGLIVFPDPIFSPLRSLIFELAAKQHHPAIYPFLNWAEDGGLLSYGINILDQVRRSAFYVEQILKGARPGDLPVQAPTQFELVINLKTAKALGLDVPPTLLARADQVIE
jgi:putative ABC transport system substrate-binding protein